MHKLCITLIKFIYMNIFIRHILKSYCDPNSKPPSLGPNTIYQQIKEITTRSVSHPRSYIFSFFHQVCRRKNGERKTWSTRSWSSEVASAPRSSSAMAVKSSCLTSSRLLFLGKDGKKETLVLHFTGPGSASC